MWPKGNIERQPSSVKPQEGIFVTKGFDPERRSLLIGLAYSIVAVVAPGIAFGTTATCSCDDVDWDNVINEVIGHRSRTIMGPKPTTVPFEPGSLQGCMQKAMDLQFDGSRWSE